MKQLVILIFLALFILPTSNAQEIKDTVFFMNGEIITGKVHDTLPEFIHITYIHKNKPKEARIETDRLFSVKYANDTEYFYYQSDTLVEDSFSKEEARFFITGERDATTGYKSKLILPIGLLIGVASPFFIPAILSPVPSLLYMGAIQLPKIKINTKEIPNKENLKQYYYLLGYERVARKKLLFRSLIGCAVGLIAGYTYVHIR